MNIDFPRAAHIDDLLVIETTVADLSGARLVLDQAIGRGTEVIATARVLVVAVRDGKAIRLPGSIVRAFSP